MPATRPAPPRGRGPSLHPGRVLAGRFELRDRIGSGTHSTVHRARDRATGTWVAVKVLDSHHGGLLPRFLHEQSLRIDHPHVLAPTGWAAEDELVLLTSPLVGGGSLADLLRRHGPLPTGLVTTLLDQLLDALTAVHAAGVVHRDVKPANLLLEATGTGPPHLRLADFGVAARSPGPRLTREPGPIGTDVYMAPEQRAGADPDPRQDLYAVGVTGLHLLLGRPGRDVAAAPADLQPLLRALTETEPAARPVSARAARSLLPRPTDDGPWPALPDLLPPLPGAAWWPWCQVAALLGTWLACGAWWWQRLAG